MTFHSGATTTYAGITGDSTYCCWKKKEIRKKNRSKEDDGEEAQTAKYVHF